jgi:hypothetical protein
MTFTLFLFTANRIKINSYGLCCVLLIAAATSVKAMPVTNPAVYAAYTPLLAKGGSAAIELELVRANIAKNDVRATEDKVVLPIPTEPVVKEVIGKTPVADPELIALTLPDVAGVSNPLLLAAAVKEYTFGVLPIPTFMCANGVKSKTLKIDVMGMKNYGALQKDMCERVHNLKAYKIKMTENYREKLQEIQKSLMATTLLPESTTGLNSGKQTAIQTLQVLERVAGAEYKGKMMLADNQIAVAEDMQKYAVAAIVAGPPMTPLKALEFQAFKMGIGLAIKSAASFADSYAK